MFASVAVLIVCLHLVAANYRTCKCDIRTGGHANSPKLFSWSTRLSSRCLWCGFPGIYVSCNEVKSWCPGKCHRMAKGKVKRRAYLDSMCSKYRRIVRRPKGIRLHAYSQVMNNCGGNWNHFNLNTKLCCFRVHYRWIGYRC